MLDFAINFNFAGFSEQWIFLTYYFNYLTREEKLKKKYSKI